MRVFFRGGDFEDLVSQVHQLAAYLVAAGGAGVLEFEAEVVPFSPDGEPFEFVAGEFEPAGVTFRNGNVLRECSGKRD